MTTLGSGTLGSGTLGDPLLGEEGSRRGVVYWAEFEIPAAATLLEDFGTVTLLLRPSAIIERTDAGTAYLKLTASAVDEYTSGSVTPPAPEEPSIRVVAAFKAPRPWNIIHYDEAGNPLGQVRPEALRFGIYLSKPGFVNYDIDLSNSMATEEYVKPYTTDWELRRGYDVVKDLAGMHTEISVGEEESNFISVAGQTWLHYFQKRHWPFNPADPLQYKYTAAATDLFTIVEDILDIVLALANSLDFTYNNGTSGQTTNFKIEAGDQQDILSKFDELAKLDPGFDIEITWDRIIKLYAPKKGLTKDISFELHKNVELLNYVDRGSIPVLVGFGNVASQRAGSVATSVATRRRYEEIKDYGEVASQDALDDLVEADHARLEVANTTFSVRWTGTDDPDEVLDEIDVGDTVPVYGDTGFSVIDGDYRIVGIEGEISDESNPEYTITFDDGTLSL